MDTSLLLLVVAASLALLVVGLGIALVMARREPGRASQRRNAVAQAGEGAAEALLEAEGYTVLDRQVPVQGRMRLDGEEATFSVRLDLEVERSGRLYVAEVKTGTLAPDPTLAATRRQLREYAALLPDHGLLLVDMESETITEVDFD